MLRSKLFPALIIGAIAAHSAQALSMGESIVNKEQQARQAQEESERAAREAARHDPIAEAEAARQAQPPALLAIRSIGDRATATFESSEGTITVTKPGADISSGWRFLRVMGLSAEIQRKSKDAKKEFTPVVVYIQVKDQTAPAGSQAISAQPFSLGAGSALPPAPPFPQSMMPNTTK